MSSRYHGGIPHSQPNLAGHQYLQHRENTPSPYGGNIHNFRQNQAQFNMGSPFELQLPSLPCLLPQDVIAMGTSRLNSHETQLWIYSLLRVKFPSFEAIDHNALCHAVLWRDTGFKLCRADESCLRDVFNVNISSPHIVREIWVNSPGRGTIVDHNESDYRIMEVARKMAHSIPGHILKGALMPKLPLTFIGDDGLIYPVSGPPLNATVMPQALPNHSQKSRDGYSDLNHQVSDQSMQRFPLTARPHFGATAQSRNHFAMAAPSQNEFMSYGKLQQPSGENGSSKNPITINDMPEDRVDNNLQLHSQFYLAKGPTNAYSSLYGLDLQLTAPNIEQVSLTSEVFGLKNVSFLPDNIPKHDSTKTTRFDFNVSAVPPAAYPTPVSMGRQNSGNSEPTLNLKRHSPNLRPYIADSIQDQEVSLIPQQECADVNARNQTFEAEDMMTELFDFSGAAPSQICDNLPISQPLELDVFGISQCQFYKTIDASQALEYDFSDMFNEENGDEYSPSQWNTM